MNIPASLALAAILAGALTAGAAGGAFAQDASAKPGAMRIACFYAKDASNFVAVGNQSVNVRVGVRQVYQLKLFSPCNGISFSQSIALASSPGSFVCPGRGLGVDLFIRTSTGRQRCPVTSIRKLTDAEVAAMPKKQRP
ncbi:MAG: DUF6491 family protein [Pseudomonadota bacterium]|nr:DUF6491 family protein [Pseudomonadota bacterium]